MAFIEWLTAQYRGYSTLTILLEITAVMASVVSVLFAKKNSVLVFPYGIISTMVFCYLLYHWNLLGDLVVNAYYFVISVYGWYVWTRKTNDLPTPITRVTPSEWIVSAAIFVITAVVIFFLYKATDRLESWVSYIDMVTTGLFFAGAWQMTFRKLEYWLVLMVGNVISVPLYFYKGAAISGFLYLFLAIIAYLGYKEWKVYHIKRSSLENA